MKGVSGLPDSISRCDRVPVIQYQNDLFVPEVLFYALTSVLPNPFSYTYLASLDWVSVTHKHTVHLREVLQEWHLVQELLVHLFFWVGHLLIYRYSEKGASGNMGESLFHQNLRRRWIGSLLDYRRGFHFVGDRGYSQIESRHLWSRRLDYNMVSLLLVNRWTTFQSKWPRGR